MTGKHIFAGYAAAVASAVLFGLIALLTTSLYAAGATGFEIVFWRMAVSTVAVGTVCLATGKHLKLARHEVPWVLGTGVLYALGIVFLCLAYGTRSSAGLLNTLYHTYPIIVMLVAAVFLKRRPGGLKVCAAALAMVGTVIMFATAENWVYTAAGVACSLGSATSYALYSLTVERKEVGGVSGTVLFLYSCMVCAVLCLPFVIVTPTHLVPTAMSVGLLCLLGLACTVAPYLLYIYAARTIGAQAASLLAYIELAFTVASMAFVAGEIPSAPELVGCTLIAVAGMLTVLPDCRHSA